MSETMAREILELEESLTRATRAVDVAALDAMYADDIMMTNVMGDTPCNKSVLMDEARRGAAMRQSARDAGKPITGSYDKEDLRMVVNGETAVTSYRFVVTMKGENIDVNRRYRTTNVWMKRQGRWQVVAAHTAFVLDPRQAASLAGG